MRDSPKFASPPPRSNGSLVRRAVSLRELCEKEGFWCELAVGQSCKYRTEGMKSCPKPEGVRGPAWFVNPK